MNTPFATLQAVQKSLDLAYVEVEEAEKEAKRLVAAGSKDIDAFVALAKKCGDANSRKKWLHLLVDVFQHNGSDFFYYRKNFKGWK